MQPIKRPWYKSILFRTTMLSWLVISFTLSFFVLSITPFQKKIAINRMQSQAKSVAASVGQVTANSLVLNDYSFAVDHCLKVVDESPAIVYVVVTKHDGFSLIHTNESWRLDTLGGFWNTDFEGFHPNMLIPQEAKRPEIFHYSYPFIYSGINWGRIHIGLSLDEYNSYMASMYFRTTAMAIVCAALGLLASLFFARNISKPILQLDRVTKQIAEGDNTAKAVINSNDELESLACSFNKMTDALHEAREKLEQRVKERTKAIKHVNRVLEKEVIYRIEAEEKIKSSLVEKEILLKEIHHRVKNNLQIIQSLLYLQSRQLKDKKSQELFKDSQSRVKSMALIHEKLYRSDDFANIKFGDYIKSLTGHLLQTYQTEQSKVDVKMDISDVSFTIDLGIPCGLIVNELVTNSLKYAFPNGNKGVIEINLFSKNGQSDQNFYTLNIKDNGVGIPKDFDYKQSDSLGLKLVHNLAKQLDGTVEIDLEKGTSFTIEFSYVEEKMVTT